MTYTEALKFYLKRKAGVSTPTDSEEARAEACAIEALKIMAEKEKRTTPGMRQDDGNRKHRFGPSLGGIRCYSCFG